jgi:hypothetical protein
VRGKDLLDHIKLAGGGRAHQVHTLRTSSGDKGIILRGLELGPMLVEVSSNVAVLAVG